MTALTNPVNKQNIVDRFYDYVTATANSGIAWGDNSYPFGQWDQGNIWGGSTAGIPIAVVGGSIAAGANGEIQAQSVYDTLIAEAYRYTCIRNMRAILNVAGGGGNTGSYGAPGYIYDSTQAAYMPTSYLQTISSERSDVYADNVITATGLEAMLTSMRENYNTLRSNSAGTWITTVCHASCHSSCHSSRGRR